MEPILRSELEDDLYKISMQAAVIARYDGLDARYRFMNRGQTPFPDGFGRALSEQVASMADLRLTPDEARWLRTCPSLAWLPRAYVDFLEGYRFNPDEVAIVQAGNHLMVEVEGPWYRTIRWEVPLMATISELYYRMTGASPKYAQFFDSLGCKATLFREHRCAVTDFGTRRRFSAEIQDGVVAYLKTSVPSFMGTSNLHLAHKHGLRPIGTHAHEWFMAHAAMYGVTAANRMALEAWLSVYRGRLGTALTDTFTTEVFLRDFDHLMARQFDGVRQDSGDPIAWGHEMINHYRSLGIDPMTKIAIFSDSLDAARAVTIQNEFSGKMGVAFGIGTNLTNDVGHPPLNMVIKATAFRVNGTWVPVAKLSDDVGKTSGDVADIYRATLRI